MFLSFPSATHYQISSDVRDKWVHGVDEVLALGHVVPRLVIQHDFDLSTKYNILFLFWILIKKDAAVSPHRRPRDPHSRSSSKQRNWTPLCRTWRNSRSSQRLVSDSRTRLTWYFEWIVGTDSMNCRREVSCFGRPMSTESCIRPRPPQIWIRTRRSRAARRCRHLHCRGDSLCSTSWLFSWSVCAASRH